MNQRLPSCASTVLVIAASLLFTLKVSAQVGSRPYEVVSSNANELVVHIAPKYWTRTVHASGKIFTRVGFDGGAATDSAGSAELFKLILPVLTPDRSPIHTEILSQSLEVLPNIDLAPVPEYSIVGGESKATYRVNDLRYRQSGPQLVEAGIPGTMRTAYSNQVTIAPVEYDAATRTVTRVKELTLRIKFPTNALRPASVSSTERDLFSGNFVNGNVSEFYRSAVGEITAQVRTAPAFKGIHPLDDGKWIQIETTNEGIYRITAQDLANAGLTAVDPSTIELFGQGGEVLNESLTGSNGEWLERPIDLRTNGQSFTELYFYAGGITTWKYAGGQGTPFNGLFHKLNPYASAGHFLLKVGGSRIGDGLRVRVAADTVTATPVESDRVVASTLHEVERIFEIPNIGRELLGESIPRADAGPLALGIDLPGYAGDSVAVRVAYDNSTIPNSTAAVAVSVSGSTIGTIQSRTGTGVQRNWDNAFYLNPGSSTLNLALAYTSNDITSPAWLDFVEVMYNRKTDIGANSIPFMVIDTKSAFNYTFANASGGAVWDVTNSANPHIVASANGASIPVMLQGSSGIMRKFIAYSAQSSMTPTLTPIATAPSLRSTVGQQGAQEIIIAPAAFLTQANELKDIRAQGGEATEPISAAVVTLEDIYREFGYGTKDVGAVRDFLSYTFRHTAKNGTTIPIYVVLMGSGHPDYQNRVTNVADLFPPWESDASEYLGTMRTSLEIPYPDDGFFERLVPNRGYNQLDVAAGRISAHTPDEAEGVVQKIRHYEHGSAQGDWRARTSFVADDRVADPPDQPDGIDHLGDTEAEIRNLQERLAVNKIYEVSYPTLFTSTGRTRAGVEDAIVNAFNDGSVLLSFVGHGNPKVWTHEGVLSVPSTINKFSNFDRLAFLTTATCDFSAYDNFDDVSGGTQMLLKPDGGAIGLLGTSRSVTGSENLVWVFYQTLFHTNGTFGTSSVGSAFLAGKAACTSGNLPHYYILGDPAQRLLVPRLYVNFDEINGHPAAQNQVLPALSEVRIQGSIVESQNPNSPAVSNFSGTTTVTLYDADSRNTALSIFPNDSIVDQYMVAGPILYKGTATVTNGKFSLNFIIPKDIKFDTLAAKLTGLAYADDGRSALGDTRNLSLQGSDTLAAVIDTSGPQIGLFIGNRAFHSGDAVSMHSDVIVDISDPHGLNTSTASVGHQFVAWIDDSTSGAIDLAQFFVSKQNDFSAGTSERPMELPAGLHTLHVRAFDTFDNPSFASVEFTAKRDEPYHLYDVLNFPNPLIDHTTFSFVQPGGAGSLIHATLNIYATDGARVKTIQLDSRQSAISIVWDGRDDSGLRVANGAYVYQIQVNDETENTSSLSQGRLIVAH